MIKLRGHHARNIEFYLFNKDRNGLRFTGNFDYNLYFDFLGSVYKSPGFAKHIWKTYNHLVDENPDVRLINECDDICNPVCPYLIKQRMECRNNYLGLYKEHDDELKVLDNICIEDFGLSVGEEVKFSRLFRIIINRNYEGMGFECFDNFIENIDCILHPKLVDLYMK